MHFQNMNMKKNVAQEKLFFQLSVSHTDVFFNVPVHCNLAHMYIKGEKLFAYNQFFIFTQNKERYRLHTRDTHKYIYTSYVKSENRQKK